MESTPTFNFIAPKSSKKQKTFTFCIEESDDFSKLVTVKVYKKKPVVDVRVHDVNDYKTVPTKKGVQLDHAGWMRLMACAQDLKDAFDVKNTDAKFWLKSETDREQPAHVFAGLFAPGGSKYAYISLSNYFQPDPESMDIFPTGRSICLKHDQFEKLLGLNQDIENALQSLVEE